MHPNPFAGPIPFSGRRRLAVAHIEATLALAYEQRTANLIAVAVAQDARGVVGDRYWNEVADRLGLGGES
jgi:hypothetical protein